MLTFEGCISTAIICRRNSERRFVSIISHPDECIKQLQEESIHALINYDRPDSNQL